MGVAVLSSGVGRDVLLAVAVGIGEGVGIGSGDDTVGVGKGDGCEIPGNGGLTMSSVNAAMASTSRKRRVIAAAPRARRASYLVRAEYQPSQVRG